MFVAWFTLAPALAADVAGVERTLEASGLVVALDEVMARYGQVVTLECAPRPIRGVHYDVPPEAPFDARPGGALQGRGMPARKIAKYPVAVRYEEVPGDARASTVNAVQAVIAAREPARQPERYRLLTDELALHVVPTHEHLPGGALRAVDSVLEIRVHDTGATEQAMVVADVVDQLARDRGIAIRFDAGWDHALQGEVSVAARDARKRVRSSQPLRTARSLLTAALVDGESTRTWTLCGTTLPGYPDAALGVRPLPAPRQAEP